MKTDIRSLVFTKRLFKELYNIDVTWNIDKFSKADGYFTFNGKEYLIECKARRFPSSKYKTTIINRDKFEYLSRNNSILVIIFQDGMYIFKDIKKAVVRDSLKYGRTTTDFGGYYRYSLKTELDLNKAIKVDVDTSFVYV